eukprot:scaffold41078_cov64-Phaeocystis_antarctica.AAC.2
MQANESRKRSDSRRRSAWYLAMLCLVLMFSVWRVVRPRETLMAVESVRNAPPRRRPLPAHLLALRNPADLRFTLVEELDAPLSRDRLAGKEALMGGDVSPASTHASAQLRRVNVSSVSAVNGSSSGVSPGGPS